MNDFEPNRPGCGSFHQNRDDCWDFHTFSDCRFNVRCRKLHDTSRRCEQSFGVTKICSITKSCYGGYEVEVVNRTGGIKTYYVPRVEYLKKATKGNLVIVQESSEIHGAARINYGKICAILHESQGIHEACIPLEEDLMDGFSFVVKSRNLRTITYAFSTNICKDHGQDCKRIGVHIRTTAIGDQCKKLDRNFVPFHKTHPRDQAGGFTADSIQLAVSVYSHSACDHIEQPVLTSLFIDSAHFLDCNDEVLRREYVQDMWELFAKDYFIEDVSSTVASLLLVNSPTSWRQKLIIRNSLNFFNQQITLYLRSKMGKFVLASHARPTFGTPDGEIVIPDKVIDSIDLAWKSSSDSKVDEREDALAHLLGSAKRTDERFWRGYKDWYTLVAISCNELTDSHIVMTASPIGQTSNYVNQQILLALMITPSISLYSGNEMLGFVIRRYETPIIQKAVVRRMRKEDLHLQFIGVHGRSRGKRDMLIRDLFGGECLESSSLSYSSDDHGDSESEYMRGISFMMQNQTCDEYCNTKLVVLQGEQLTTLVGTVKKHGIDSSKTAESIHRIVATKTVDGSPYAAIKGGGTKVTLRRGTELQIQVAIKSEFDENDRGTFLRLLRIGKDCHECLAHLNDPEKAFLITNRRDVRDLLFPDLADKIVENIRKHPTTTAIFKDKLIIWDDEYFSGGRFRFSEGDVKQSNLLCIRREILASNESDLSFVWVCHAVVSRVSDGEVTFLVCSLYQDHTPDMMFTDDIGFIVEVIDIDIVNSDQCNTET